MSALLAAFTGLSVGCGALAGLDDYREGDDSVVAAADVGLAEAALDSAAGDAVTSRDGDAVVGDGVSPCVKLTAAQCESSAIDLGSISGDTGAETKSASGTNSTFLRIRLMERESDWGLDAPLKARVRLNTSGPNDFDLFVYAGDASGSGGALNCSSVTKSSTSTTTSHEVYVSFPDSDPPSGYDGTRTLSIEVRARGSDCTATGWSLVVTGNIG